MVALPNTVPGTAQYTGRHDGAASAGTHVRFTADEVRVDDFPPAPAEPRAGWVDWYDWRGLGDAARAVALAERLGVPPLAIEDILDVQQRAKYEEREEAFLLLVPHLHVGSSGECVREHVAIFWTRAFVATFQEYPADLFNAVRARIETAQGRVRTRGTTYLAYALADSIVDAYLGVLGSIEERTDRLEDDILAGRDLDQAKVRIHDLKRTVNELRRTLVPLREATGRWLKSEHPGREAKITPFLRDLSDNVARAYELTESYGTRASDLYNLYNSELAAATNNVVQALTVISAIFIPLTFLAGIYGMNFRYIPELDEPNGYFVLLGVMAAITVTLLVYFRRKGWI